MIARLQVVPKIFLRVELSKVQVTLVKFVDLKRFVNISGFCVPYSIQACLDAIYRLGLKKGGAGYSFEGDYSVKGCYAYVGIHSTYPDMAFYGTGGTEDQMKALINHPTFRPIGYDCSPIGLSIIASFYTQCFQVKHGVNF